jgi:hypothetical protein
MITRRGWVWPVELSGDYGLQFREDAGRLVFGATDWAKDKEFLIRSRQDHPIAVSRTDKRPNCVPH